ncbi:MAG: hypothetical protein JWL62_965 [Hyphomicrobiales bacterium]|nr:hypothetical protein [Hyphomicrobiales bacterium]
MPGKACNKACAKPPDRPATLLYIAGCMLDEAVPAASPYSLHLREFALTESSISSAGLDPRRRRVLFRSWHRGMREMDIIYGKFSDSEIAKLSDAELDDYELLMDLPDRDVLMFVTGEAETPESFNTPVFRRMKAFHTHSGPIFG